MEKIVVRPKYIRMALIYSFSTIISIGLYEFFFGKETALDSIAISIGTVLASHLIGMTLHYKKHAQELSITLSHKGIEGPKVKFFGSIERVFIAYQDIEKVTNVGIPHWIVATKVVSKSRTKISINGEFTSNDYRLILKTLDNHNVQVSDYVWQIYPDS